MSGRSRSSLGLAIVAAVAVPGVLIIATLVRSARSPMSLANRTTPVDGTPSAVAIAAGLAWVADDAGDVLYGIDPSTRAIIRRIEVAHNPIALAAQGRWLWVAHANGVVERIDAAEGVAGPRINAGESITGIAAFGNRVWVCDLPNDALIEIDARRARVVRRVHVAKGTVRVVASDDALWVTNRENTVTRVDPQTGKASPPIRVGPGPIGLDYADGTVWVANSDDGTVTRIDARSRRRIGSPLPVGRGPVAVSAGSGAVWVVLQDDRTVVRLDPQTGRAVGKPLVIGTHPRGIASSGNGVLIVGTDPGALVRVS